MMQGKVLKVGQDKVSGKDVTLQHGNFTVSYYHLSQISVSQGQAVLSGNVGLQVIPGVAPGSICILLANTLVIA